MLTQCKPARKQTLSDIVASPIKNNHETKSSIAQLGPCAHFSDRGRLFQADRGRRFSAIVDAQGMRASEGLMYLKGQSCLRTAAAKRVG